ncbi:MAG: DUF308 domain-containing protein [Sphaerochaeta sp.]|uniref:DUF308 domain-containing protein n=1 Tax=Sphaerochaeta sp. TaxID=1972642 RepID=UPI001DD466FF|nr:DUF308 domain-containing protein [uncultured Sphaerochaeta sp.]MDD3929098.1 DUF308 domain-containing protein [Sphaerochaeta sp.]NCC89061.1 hypothetical protein [Spirochaetia bacterium]
MQDTFFKRHLMLATIFGSFLVVLGIYLMFQQESFVRIFISILGLFLVGSGVASLFALRSYSLGRRTKTATLVQAILSIVLGLVAVIVPLSAANVSWTLMLSLIAIELIFSALISFLDAILLRKSELPVSALLGEGVFSLVVAVLLFVFPQQIGSMLLKLFGVVIIAMGLGMVLWSVRIRKINRQFSQTVIEAEAVVVDESGN